MFFGVKDGLIEYSLECRADGVNREEVLEVGFGFGWFSAGDFFDKGDEFAAEFLNGLSFQHLTSVQVNVIFHFLEKFGIGRYFDHGHDGESSGGASSG